MNKKNLLFLVLALVAILAFIGYREWNRGAKDLKNVRPQYSLAATELIAAFAADTASSNRKYADQVVEVRGVVKSIDSNGNPVVIALGQLGEMSSVQCSMDSTYNKEYSGIKEGDTVQVKGLCAGGKTEDLFGTDVILNRCVLPNR